MLVVDKLYREDRPDGSKRYFMLRRKFLGKLEDFESNEERKFEKLHLKAYLNAHDNFKYKGVRFRTHQGVSIVDMTEKEVNKLMKRGVQPIDLIFTPEETTEPITTETQQTVAND